MFRITVNGNELDLSDPKSIVLNEEVFNLTKPNLKTVSYTNRIVLPRTANNARTLNILSQERYSAAFDSIVYYKSVSMVRGKARITGVTKDDITIQITDELRDFWLLTQSPLYEMDLSSWDFTFNRTAFTTYRVNTVSNLWLWTAIYFKDPILWGGINNLDLYNYPTGLGFTAGQTDLGVSRPCYRVSQVLKEIITHNGFQHDLDDVEDIIDDLVLTSNAEDFLFTDMQEKFNGVITAGSFLDYIDSTAEHGIRNFFSVTGTTLTTLKLQSKLAFTGKLTGNEVTEMILSSRVSGVTAYSDARYLIIGEDVNIITDLFEPGTEVKISFTDDVTLASFRVVGLTNEVDLYTYAGTIDGTGTIEGWYLNPNGPTAYTEMLKSYYIKAQFNLPNWTQFQFIAEVSKLFNLQFESVGGTIKVTFKKDVNKFSKATYSNLDDLVEANKTEIHDILEYKFKDDDPLGNFKIRYDNPNLKNEVLTIVEMSTDVTKDREVPGEPMKMASVPIYKILASGANTNADDRAILNHRFLFIDTRDIAPAANLTEMVTQGYYDNTSPTGVANDKSLAMKQLYDLYYSFIYENLSKALKIEFSKKITYSQFKRLVQDKVIYIEQYGLYFYVLSVSKFNPLTKSTIKGISF